MQPKKNSHIKGSNGDRIADIIDPIAAIAIRESQNLMSFIGSRFIRHTLIAYKFYYI